MLRFRLFGVPCEITPYFWIGSAILSGNLLREANGFSLLVVWVLCVLVSILAHELGHALAARGLGAQSRIALYQFGGLTSYLGGTFSRGQRILVSLAGPAVGFAVYLAVRAATPLLGRFFYQETLSGEPTQAAFLLGSAIFFLLQINGWWTVFNLLPILPLDGGQVMREALGPNRMLVTRMIGGVCAVACCVAAALYGRYYTAFFLGWMAYSNLVGDTRSFTGGTRF